MHCNENHHDCSSDALAEAKPIKQKQRPCCPPSKVTKVYSRSVDPRKLRVGVKYCVYSTFLHTSKKKILFFFSFFHVNQNHYYTSRITQMYRGKVAGKIKKDGTEIKFTKSHSAAPGMHAYIARELRAKIQLLCCCLLCIFLSWWSSQSNPNKLK